MESKSHTIAGWIRALSLGLVGTCPKCRQGRMFSSHFRIHTRCPHCGVKFQPYQGDSLGVYALSYFLTIIPSMLAFVLAFKYLNLGAMGLLAIFSTVAGVVLFGFFPNMKGLWALVYLATGLRPNL